MIEMYITAAGGGTNKYVSTMSTHPQWEGAASQSFKTHMPKNAAALVRRRQYLPKIFPLSHKFVRLSRKFARIVSDIFVSQAIVHMQLGGGNLAIAKLDTSQNLTSFLSTKLPT